jgi:hypothetical protein
LSSSRNKTGGRSPRKHNIAITLVRRQVEAALAPVPEAGYPPPPLASTLPAGLRDFPHDLLCSCSLSPAAPRPLVCLGASLAKYGDARPRRAGWNDGRRRSCAGAACAYGRFEASKVGGRMGVRVAGNTVYTKTTR